MLASLICLGFALNFGELRRDRSWKQLLLVLELFRSCGRPYLHASRRNPGVDKIDCHSTWPRPIEVHTIQRMARKRDGFSTTIIMPLQPQNSSSGATRRGRTHESTQHPSALSPNPRRPPKPLPLDHPVAGALERLPNRRIVDQRYSGSKTTRKGALPINYDECPTNRAPTIPTHGSFSLFQRFVLPGQK